MNKDEAIKKLSDFYGGKPLLPNAFKERNHIEEIKGVYVPFWLYDGTADADMAFRGTISHSHREGDYTVTVTENYSILRQGTVQFNRVPADGSSKMPDEFMDAIEPYNYKDMIPFEMGYMTGYLADRYDVTAEQDRGRVNLRMRTSAADKIRETVRGYHTLLPRRSNIYIREDKVHYAFLPVWMLTTKWQGMRGDKNAEFHVAVMDYGVKENILRSLELAGCRLTVFPADSKAEDVLAVNPDGIFLSNGPGDPQDLGYAVEEVKKMFGKKPIFGICMGHQVLAQAYGGTTFKLKFGHRGSNHPVQDLRTGRVYITSQNHGFAVDDSSLPDYIEITHRSVNDGTVEGMRHKELPIFSVQYHPEASPGPTDNLYLFDEFEDMMRKGK